MDISAEDVKLWEEIWGCVNYLNIPYDTVMEMPVYVRKYWIQRHNAACAEEQEQYNQAKNGNKGSTIGGVSINSYAAIEQQNMNKP